MKGQDIRLIESTPKTHSEWYQNRVTIERFVSLGRSPNTILLMVPRLRGFGFGYFDDIDSILRYDLVQRDDINVMRRTDGGGCIYHDYGTGGYFSPALKTDLFSSAGDALGTFLELCEATLVTLGVKLDDLQRVHGDLRWGKKKIGSVSYALFREKDGDGVYSGFITPSYNRMPPDMDIYMKYAVVSSEKMKDKGISLSDYFCNLLEVLGREVSPEETIAAMRKAVEQVLGLRVGRIYTGEFTSEELQFRDNLIEKLSREDWICRVSSRRFFERVAKNGWRFGYAQYKSNKLIKCGVAIDQQGSIIRELMMAGDMYVSPITVIDTMAEALVGCHSGDKKELLARIISVLHGPEVKVAEAHTVTPEEYLEVVNLAVLDAQREYPNLAGIELYEAHMRQFGI